MPKNNSKTLPRVASPKNDSSLSFTMQVADNFRVKGVFYGIRAMTKAGIQPEFAAHNIIQAAALKSAVILRAGDPPQYNKDRSPKSGVNLSKTSKQGFFKGTLSKEERFESILVDNTKPLGLARLSFLDFKKHPNSENTDTPSV